MNTQNFVVETNKAHERYIQKLQNKSDDNFSYWLSSAATHLCVIFDDVKLKDKLTHVDELVQAVKKGFKRKDMPRNLSRVEQNDLMYSKALFTKIFKNKPDESHVSGLKELELEVVQDSMTAKGTGVKGKEAECTMGRHSFIIPKTLPRSHKFCMHCLENYGRINKKCLIDFMPCEKHRQKSNNIQGGPDSLVNVDEVEKVFKPVVVKGTIPSPHACELCATNSNIHEATEATAAVKWCPDCEKLLSANCRRSRKKNNLLNTHVVQDLENSLNDSAASGKLTTESNRGKIIILYA